MQLDGIFDTTVNLLGKSLDLRAQNQNRIAANIANVETPGYIPTALHFERELQSALQNGRDMAGTRTNPRHIPLKGSATGLEQVQGTVVAVTEGSPGRDGNGVELEDEMGNLMENQIMFNANVQLLSKKFEELKMAIKGDV